MESKKKLLHCKLYKKGQPVKFKHALVVETIVASSNTIAMGTNK